MQKLELRDEARGRWRSILPMLGLDSRFLSEKQGPCPKCGGKDRFRFDDKDGDGTWICNQCGAGDGAKLAMEITGMGFADTAKAIRETLPETIVTKPKPEISEDFALRLRRELYRQSVPTKGTLAEDYLRGRNLLGPYPETLRFVAMARVNDELNLPAMIGMVSDRAGKIVNIHRTFLDGAAKANIPSPRQMMPGKVPDESAIRLGPVEEHIGIAEGIETALAVKRKFGVNCWSAICSSMLEKFVPPQEVKTVTVYGDNDPKYGGQASAYRLAHKLSTLRYAIKVDAVEIPYVSGKDWADCII